MLLPLSVSCSKVSLLSKLSARAWQLDKAEAHSKDTILHKITRRFIHLKMSGKAPKTTDLQQPSTTCLKSPPLSHWRFLPCFQAHPMAHNTAAPRRHLTTASTDAVLFEDETLQTAIAFEAIRQGLANR